MADAKDDGKGGKNGGAAEAAAQAHVHVMGQYVKDLSFENPNIARLLEAPGETPNMNLEVHVNAQRMGTDVYESAIDLKARATNPKGVIYNLEIVYAGLFRVQNIPEPALEGFLLVNCPALIFPFLRRLVADISREGGFPPLLLDPLDFGGLFMRRKQERAAAASGTKKA